MESSWPVAHSSGRQAELIWPDYGGEQIKNLLSTHRIAAAWRDRVLAATNWILLVRPHTLKGNEDIFSRPLADLGTSNTEGAKYKPSDQARLIELLQILLHISGVSREGGMSKPTLTVLLSCWDELEAKAVPLEVLRSNLPMFCDFIESVWKQPIIIGLSALGRPLSKEQSDTEYSTRGPESFGYVVLPDGIEDKDITWPIARLFATN